MASEADLTFTDAVEGEGTRMKFLVSRSPSVAELRKKYTPNFRNVLSSNNTALFYARDRRVQLMIDLQLASSLPLISPAGQRYYPSRGAPGSRPPVGREPGPPGLHTPQPWATHRLRPSVLASACLNHDIVRSLIRLGELLL